MCPATALHLATLVFFMDDTKESLAIAITGPRAASVINCLIKEYLLPPFTDVVLQLHPHARPHTKWYCLVDGASVLDEEWAFDDCTGWKPLKRAMYLKGLWATLEDKRTAKLHLQRLEVYYPVHLPFHAPGLWHLTTATSGAYVQFSTAEVDWAGPEWLSISGPTGIPNSDLSYVVQPAEALLSYLSDVETEASIQFNRFIKMMARVMRADREDQTRMLRAHDLDAVGELMSATNADTKTQTEIQTLPAESCRPSGGQPPAPGWHPHDNDWKPATPEWKPRRDEWKPPAPSWAPCADNWKPQTPAWAPRADGWKPAIIEWKPSTDSWKPPPSDWKPPANNWRPNKGGWTPPADVWKPQEGQWQPRPSGWMPPKPSWSPAPQDWQPPTVDWQPRCVH
uniref:Uncharacterized protein n=1 Tax=Eutreptiella gymnastica TaxID=73025 RepID=A0A7S1J1R0_9EUGL